MRLRTIEQAATYIKEYDPGTALTKTALRRLVITGAIPSVRVGSKYLLDVEAIEKHFRNTEANGNMSDRAAP